MYAVHDYGAMRNQFKLMERRYGIVNKVVTVPVHPQIRSRNRGYLCSSDNRSNEIDHGMPYDQYNGAYSADPKNL